MRPVYLLAGSLALSISQLWAADLAPGFFTTSVVPVLEKAGCVGCHKPDGVASGTRLKFPESGPAHENFGLALHPLIDRKTPENSLLLTKPTKRVPHAGGMRIKPGTPEEQALRTWVLHLAKLEPSAAAKMEEHVEKPAGPVLRRLTHTQYNNTVRDLLGDDSRLADSFPPEDFVNGFKTQYLAQSISPLLAEAYSAAAEKLAATAFRSDTQKLIPCKPATAGCDVKFIEQFGRRAFRRPLTAAETARYRKLLASSPKFLEGAQLVVEAMLQSPAFLMRTENGADPKLRAWERASQLSYMLWNSMPDAELFRAAGAGEIDSAAGFEKQARRMLADPRARDAVDEFAAQWLRFDRLLTSVKDRRTFPMYTPELGLSMTEETRRLIADLVWNGGDFRKFYSADYTFLSSDLAGVYKLPPPKEEFGRVTLPPESGRAGVVGQAVFLALTSKPAETSPTARGLFVREQFLCQEVPPPPPGASANLPVITKARPMTNRERLAVHLNNESCASCHVLVDSIGFGLEKFDAIGQHRDKLKIVFRGGRGEAEKEPGSVELDLDTTGHIAGIKDSAFSSPKGLGEVLGRSEQCQECVVKQFFRYSAGRKESAADRAAIRRAFERFRDSGFQFREMMVALARETAFSAAPEAAVVGGSN